MPEINVTSFIWVNFAAGIFLPLLMFITGRVKTMPVIPIQILMFTAAAVGLRLIFPAEFPAVNKIINIYTTLPPIYAIMNKPLTEDGTLTPYVIFCIIWGAVAAVLLLIYIVRSVRLMRLIKHTPQTASPQLELLEKLKNELGFRFKTKLIRDSAVEFPSEYGFTEQTIFLNDADYTDEELTCIFRHELAHFRYGTNLMRLFVNVVCILLWWNPVMHLFRHCFDERVEIYVDGKATHGMTEKEKSAYMRCILKVYEIISQGGRRSVMLEPLTGSSERLMMKRFKILADNRDTNVLLSSAAVLLTIGFWVFSCKYQFQLGWQPPANEVRNISIDEVTAENSYIIHNTQTNSYVLYIDTGDTVVPLQLTDELLERYSHIPITEE